MKKMPSGRKKLIIKRIPIEISPVLRDLITVIFCY